MHTQKSEDILYKSLKAVDISQKLSKILLQDFPILSKALVCVPSFINALTVSDSILLNYSSYCIKYNFNIPKIEGQKEIKKKITKYLKENSIDIICGFEYFDSIHHSDAKECFNNYIFTRIETLLSSSPNIHEEQYCKICLNNLSEYSYYNSYDKNVFEKKDSDYTLHFEGLDNIDFSEKCIDESLLEIRIKGSPILCIIKLYFEKLLAWEDNISKKTIGMNEEQISEFIMMQLLMRKLV